MNKDRDNAYKIDEIVEMLKKYCNQSQIEKFLSTLDKQAISSFIVNTYSQNNVIDFSNITNQENDSLLYRFNKDENRLGKSIEHFSGQFYILDPSSASISRYLTKYLPDDFISLDLCAAPGGKSISLAMRRHDGIYFANDISFNRAIEIKKNVDRLGLTNIYSLSMDPMKLELNGLFDLLIVDVPCSGNGMIRKEEKMLVDFSTDKVERLLPIQANLLEKAYDLVKPGGIICYSTCSYSTEEDEEQIIKFMKKHLDIEIINLNTDEFINGVNNIGYHMVSGNFLGEGIYFAILRKKGESKYKLTEIKYNDAIKIDNKHTFSYKDNEYVLNKNFAPFAKLPYISPGLQIYDKTKYKKCDYDHSFSKIVNIQLIELDRVEAIKYCLGNEIICKGNYSDGLCVLTYKNNRLGFGKKVKNSIKNYLPKGLKCSVL